MTILKGNFKNNILNGGINNDAIYGFGGNDTIFGNDGDDYLDGGKGADSLRGDNGNDQLFGGDDNDSLNGNLGNDMLDGGQGIDALDGGAGNDALYGQSGNDSLIGGAGNDYLEGGNGLDTLTGGLGNDTYMLTGVITNSNGTGSDVIIEQANGGNDTIKSAMTGFGIVLAANVENLVLIEFAKNGIGNVLNNTMIGNDYDNDLRGLAGNDIIDGGSGRDFLFGDEGNDTLLLKDITYDVIDGGLGNDTLQIYGENQTIDLRLGKPNSDFIESIETIQFADDNNSTLIVTADDILRESPETKTLKIDAKGENTLVMDRGWTDNGLTNGYQSFSKDGATLLVNNNIGNIEELSGISAYTISNAETAAEVGAVFDRFSQEITIDFGGQAYKNTGLTSIDLTGFGVEDKLFIAREDGALSSASSHQKTQFGSRSAIRTIIHNEPFSAIAASDRFILESAGRTTAILKSVVMSRNFYPVTHTYTHISPSSTYIYRTVTFQPSFKALSASIKITGLPDNLLASQIVFV